MPSFYVFITLCCRIFTISLGLVTLLYITFGVCGYLVSHITLIHDEHIVIISACLTVVWSGDRKHHHVELARWSVPIYC